MKSEWRRKLDKRKRMKARRQRREELYAEHMISLSKSGKLTWEAMVAAAYKYLGKKA